MEYKETEICSLRCIVRYPDDFDKTKKHPVILFLHGAGTRGNDINVLRNNAYFILTEKHIGFPFITVAPQCNKNSWFELLNELRDITNYIKKQPFADKKKVYAVGTSMGGYGVWQLAMNMPSAFAAIIPVCGGGMSWNAKRLEGTPVWAFHGDSDTVVFPDESVRLVKKINTNGGYAKLTLFENTGHDVWSKVYSDISIFNWLLGCKNTYTEKRGNELADSDIYG